MRLVDGSQMPTSDSVGDAERKSVLLPGMLRWRYPCEDVDLRKCCQVKLAGPSGSHATVQHRFQWVVLL